MQLLMRRLLVVALCVALTGCFDRELSSEEIEALLSDAEVTGTHKIEAYEFRRQYNADGTFTQGPTGRYPARTGMWHVASDQVCITWSDETLPLCRNIMTDDTGNYWKELKKRKGGSKTVVQYHSFRDKNGQDRRRILSDGDRWRNMLFSWRAWWIWVLVVIASFFVIRAIARYLKALPAGHMVVRRNRIRHLPEDKRDAYMRACIIHRQHEGAALAFKAVKMSVFSPSIAWSRIWPLFADVTDDLAFSTIEVILRDEDDLGPLLRSVGEDLYLDVRCAYFFGKLCVERQRRFQTTNESRFESAKSQAMQYLEWVREKHASSPYRGDSGYGNENALQLDESVGPTAHYATLAGPLLESAMYMNYAPPKKGKGRGSAAVMAGG